VTSSYLESFRVHHLRVPRSERILYQITMDYSSSVHDADNLAGASPWGSSPTPSPHHSRTSFGPTGGDAPGSPTQYRGHQSNGSYGSEASADFMRSEGSGSISGQDISEDVQRPDAAVPIQAQNEQIFSQAQPQQHQQAQPSQQTLPPERAPASRRPQGQQYKLQAKITGLERTGRKDPILRFDVHVRIPEGRSLRRELTCCIDQFAFLSNHTVPRCPKDPFRIRQAW
jgi:hypothetical protein